METKQPLKREVGLPRQRSPPAGRRPAALHGAGASGPRGPEQQTALRGRGRVGTHAHARPQAPTGPRRRGPWRLGTVTEQQLGRPQGPQSLPECKPSGGSAEATLGPASGQRDGQRPGCGDCSPWKGRESSCGETEAPSSHTRGAATGGLRVTYLILHKDAVAPRPGVQGGGGTGLEKLLSLV